MMMLMTMLISVVVTGTTTTATTTTTTVEAEMIGVGGRMAGVTESNKRLFHNDGASAAAKRMVVVRTAAYSCCEPYSCSENSEDNQSFRDTHKRT